MNLTPAAPASDHLRIQASDARPGLSEPT